MNMVRSGIFWLALTGVAVAQTPAVTIDHAWARATLPHQDEGVAYLTMTSGAGDTLSGIDTPDAGMAMLHATVTVNGRSDMRDVDSVVLPAGEHVKLSPRGLHVMLMGMKHPLAAGDKLHLTLNFLKAGPVMVDVPVLPVGASAPP